jgi:two-component system phosphate regulon sensor histidine kinase PhoR
VKRTGESSPPGPKRGAFFWKLYLSYSGLVLVSALVIGALVLSALRSGVLRDTEASLQRTARMLASLEATNPGHLWSDQLGRQVAEVAGDTGLHLTVLFANGTIAAESAPTLGGGMGGAALELPEFRGARHSNVGRATRVLPGAEVEHLFVAVPILLDFEMIGYVRLGLSLTGLTARQIELRDRVIAGTSFNVLIALGLGFFFAQHMTRPLAEIGAICRRLAAGNFEERIGLKRADEVGVVAATIDQMAGEVQRRVAGETRERQRLAALLSVMADGVIAVSARETIAYMNDVAARLLGLDSASVGQLFRERVRLAAVREPYEEALAANERVVREVRITGHPQDLVLRVDATPLRDAAGGPFGVLLVLHDLTSIRRLEEVRRTFTANVSHELKTPLTAIATLVDSLVEDEAMPAALRRRFLGKIGNQNERLSRLVQDLLIISRLESEKEVLESHPVELVKILDDCVQTFAEVAQKKGVSLEWELPEPPVTVSANDESLFLIFNNLLHNAVTHTPPGGTVRLSAVAASGLVHVVVMDTGIGIAAEHLERIFERFYRVDKSRARGAGGTGLGLSIVKHLTQALNGTVVVESKPGAGSTFTVSLPQAPHSVSAN